MPQETSSTSKLTPWQRVKPHLVLGLQDAAIVGAGHFLGEVGLGSAFYAGKRTGALNFLSEMTPAQRETLRKRIRLGATGMSFLGTQIHRAAHLERVQRELDRLEKEAKTFKENGSEKAASVVQMYRGLLGR